MVELGVQVKASAGVTEVAKAMRLIDYTYYTLYFSTMIFLGVMVLTMYVNISSNEPN